MFENFHQTRICVICQRQFGYTPTAEMRSQVLKLCGFNHHYYEDANTDSTDFHILNEALSGSVQHRAGVSCIYCDLNLLYLVVHVFFVKRKKNTVKDMQIFIIFLVLFCLAFLSKQSYCKKNSLIASSIPRARMCKCMYVSE